VRQAHAGIEATGNELFGHSEEMADDEGRLLHRIEQYLASMVDEQLLLGGVAEG
jgi:hypothetical protein|tara:strand:- start:271 stop:432 length:162 start_codon:yes stop_codon:yes gene_type:complete